MLKLLVVVRAASGTTTKLTQALRIPFAICIERKQTIASNIMNMLNLFVSGADSINLMFTNENKLLRNKRFKCNK